MSDLRSKALAALRDGRVVVLRARVRTPEEPPFEVNAWVASSRQGSAVRYVVDLIQGVWGCTCRDLGGCAHVAAVQLVTGHVSAAAKPVRAAS